MKLFNIDDQYNLIFEPEVFLIHDFAELKKSRKDVKLLRKELGYIYFYCDLSSDFQRNLDPDSKKEDIKKFVKLPVKWEPDAKVKKCMEVYRYLSKTIASELLETAYRAVDKLKRHIDTLDLNERNPQTNAPIWNPKVIQDMVKGLPDLLKSVQQAEAEYIKGVEESDRLRGDKIKTFYEDGISRKFVGAS